MNKFLLGTVLGAAAGVLFARTKNTNTGNTFGDDFSNSVADTKDDLETIAQERNKIQNTLNYLQTDGVKKISKFSEDISQDIDEFNYYAEPHIARIQQKVSTIESKLDREK